MINPLYMPCKCGSFPAGYVVVEDLSNLSSFDL